MRDHPASSSVADPVALARALIRCPSVTPAEGGALAHVAHVLEAAGFAVHRPVFSAPDTPDVENLYARFGAEGPVLVLAGHTDVVPPGDERLWSHGPFEGVIEHDWLHGRGAVDMKGGVAAMLAASLRHLDAGGGRLRGSIVVLLTGDEEGPALNGTDKLLRWAVERGERFDHCLLGEPTSVERLGDTLKVGRRGSLSGVVTVHGRQGHVAYPHRADNPIRRLVPLLSSLMKPFDSGTDSFEPSNLEVTSVDVGNRAANVIPASAKARFNVRFNDLHTRESLERLLRERLAEAAHGARLELDIAPGGSDAFLTAPGLFVDLLSDAVESVTDRRPSLSTGGGTSDARFIKGYCPVVELGLVGTTMHQIDERVPVADLEALTRIYEEILRRYFATEHGRLA